MHRISRRSSYACPINFNYLPAFLFNLIGWAFVGVCFLAFVGIPIWIILWFIGVI